MRSNGFVKYAWAVLAYNILVILWGALVRATGSGAGCGSHWPSCNGEILPSIQRIETAIEFTHRVMSGIALLAVLGLVIWAFRAYPKSHHTRLGATLSGIFIITEALVGAALVLFEWVAHNESVARVYWMGLHLINTFLLVAALTLTAWWASGGSPVRLRGQGVALWGLGLGFLGVLVIGVTGAMTALGDTLYPSASLAEGLQADLSATSHFLIRLRIWHPIIAVTTGLYLIFTSGLLAMFRPERALKRFTGMLIGLFILQLLAGLVNVVLLAPVWMQIVHLFLADMVWISLVLLAASAFGQPSAATELAVEPARTVTSPLKT